MPIKICLIVFLVVGATRLGLTAADALPQIPGKIFCYNGKRGSCSVGVSAKGKLTCGHPGKVSEITWTFVGQRDGKDLYEFTRLFPLYSDNYTKETKQAHFAGERVTLFEDKDQVIVIQSADQKEDKISR